MSSSSLIQYHMADSVATLTITRPHKLNALTDDVMALVWLGKSLLAELTSAVALVSIFETCACRPLIPPLTLLVRPLTEFSRLARSVQ